MMIMVFMTRQMFFILRLEQTDLSPKNRTMTRMRFPIKLRLRRSHYEEETIYRRTNHWRHQAA